MQLFSSLWEREESFLPSFFQGLSLQPRSYLRYYIGGGGGSRQIDCAVIPRRKNQRRGREGKGKLAFELAGGTQGVKKQFLEQHFFLRERKTPWPPCNMGGGGEQCARGKPCDCNTHHHQDRTCFVCALSSDPNMETAEERRRRGRREGGEDRL